MQILPGLSAAHWCATLPEPVLAASSGSDGRPDVRRYIGNPPRMEQPALRENLLCLHLGGPKQVRRWSGGRLTVHDIEPGALTIVPSLRANSWLTRGPVDFGLIALDPEVLHRGAIEEFDCEPASCELTDLVGVRSQGLERLFRALLSSVARPGAAGRLYPESLLVVLTVALLRDHSNIASSARAAAEAPAKKGGLAQWRLRRVTDYMADRIAEDIGLTELTELCGLSRAQFFRAFKQSTGMTPHRFIAAMRLERARGLLDDGDLDGNALAAAVGLGSEARFSALFRRRFGVAPQVYRRSRR